MARMGDANGARASIATMRPSGWGLVWLGVRVEFFVITIVVRNFLFGGYPTIAGTLFVVLTGALAGLLLLQWRNARRHVTIDGLEIVNLWGTIRNHEHREIAQVMSARHVEFSLTHYRCIAVFDADGRALLRAKEDLWNKASMMELVSAFGDKVSFVPQPVSKEQLLARFPFAFGFVTRHPYRSVLLLIVALVAIAVGVDAFVRSLA